MKKHDKAPSLQESWHQEKQSAWLYRIIARHEQNQQLRSMFGKLALQAEIQSRFWEKKATSAGSELPVFKPDIRAQIAAKLVAWPGPRAIRPVLASLKVRGLSAYESRKVQPGHAMPTSLLDIGLRHRGLAGGNLRATVFGINDGLLSNASLILGMAGAHTENTLIVTTGIAGLLAGAISMAAGEYVSMRSQRELFEYQIDLERSELAQYPDQEAEELAVIYAARGMSLPEAREVTRQMVKDPERALDLLAREELGLNPNDLGSPLGAALFSFLAFTIGALIPLLPFLVSVIPDRSLELAMLLTGFTLFVIGASLSLFTGRGAFPGGLRMLLIGVAAGSFTYGIGHLLGVKLD